MQVFEIKVLEIWAMQYFLKYYSHFTIKAFLKWAYKQKISWGYFRNRTMRMCSCMSSIGEVSSIQWHERYRVVWALFCGMSSIWWCEQFSAVWALWQHIFKEHFSCWENSEEPLTGSWTSHSQVQEGLSYDGARAYVTEECFSDEGHEASLFPSNTSSQWAMGPAQSCIGQVLLGGDGRSLFF